MGVLCWWGLLWLPVFTEVKQISDSPQGTAPDTPGLGLGLVRTLAILYRQRGSLSLRCSSPEVKRAACDFCLL